MKATKKVVVFNPPAPPQPDASPAVALSSNDPTSFSNPEDVHTEKHEIRWTVDFIKKTITGSVTYNIIRTNPSAQYIILDTKEVDIKSIVSKSTNQPLEFTLGEPVKDFGKPLRIKLPELDKAHKGAFVIEYQTSGASCLLWLSRELTNDKKLPYVFSQGQAINMRSLMPCQDTPSTKATYQSEVVVPKEFFVLMSAISKGSPTIQGKEATYKFEQVNPIPSYLIAIAVGNLGSKKIGPRSTVYAEPSVLEAAAYEFAETEQMLQAAEAFAGKYIWDEYNLLVLPGSFPFGGMENPCVTFTTPTILAGDRSLTDVLAHEISHSWTGNLVTIKTFEHFWLSEGFTMYLERRILGFLHGEPFRQFQSIIGWKCLKECIQSMGPTNKDTKLVPDLKGIDPDEIFSEVPYEKGYTLLYYLEVKVGGPDEFASFLKHYIDTNKFKSIDTNTFKKQFIDYFQTRGKGKNIQDVEWDKWFYSPGMPVHENTYDNQLGVVCLELKKKWKEWNASTPSPFQSKDLEKFTIKGAQLQEFLSLIIDDPTPFEIEKVRAMQKAYDLNSVKNCEIRFRWLRLCIRARWIDQLPLILAFVTQNGRQRYLFPIYGELQPWEAVRRQTLDTFLSTKSSMLPSTQQKISKILKLSNRSLSVAKPNTGRLSNST